MLEQLVNETASGLRHSEFLLIVLPRTIRRNSGRDNGEGGDGVNGGIQKDGLGAVEFFEVRWWLEWGR